ncbi:MAG: hypothetical protein ACLR2G_04130 [Phascolarctobacterium faecium]
MPEFCLSCDRGRTAADCRNDCKNNFSVRQTEEYVKNIWIQMKAKLLEEKRLVIVNDVRIYLNSIKQIVSTIKDVGIPVSMEQDVDGGDVLVTLRIRNTKNQKSRVCLSY